jgi:Kef-type K+ transport system membrane component KefB
MKYVVTILAIALGVAGIVQLIGVALIVGAVALGVRIAKRRK